MTHLALLRPVRGQLILAAGLQAAAAVAALMPLLAIIAFTDAWLSGNPPPGLLVVVVAVAGTVGTLLAATGATLLTHRADSELTWQLQRRLAETIRRLPVPVVTGHGAGRIKKVVHDDTGALHHLVAHTLLDATALVITPLVGLIALAIIDWRLALISVIPLIAGIWWYVRAMRGSADNFVAYASQQRHINTAVVDYVHGLPVAKVYGGAGGAKTRFDASIDAFHDFFRVWSSSTAAVTTASWLVVTPAVTVTLLVLVGAAALHLGVAAPISLVAAVLLGPAVSAPVAAAGPRLQAIRTGLSALRSIAEFLDQPALAWGDGAASGDAAVRMDHVSFRYDDGTIAIDDVTIELPATGLIAIVGASGSGKSTMAALLARFIDPTAGRILLGGADLRELTEAQLYERIGFVFQDTRLRDASVRDTLTGGRPAADDDIIRATTASAVHDDILALPAGYDTVIGEDTDLSGGQRQRLCLARALLRGPAVLVLDEVTSAVDPTTRGTLLETLEGEAAHRAVLLITHRLATITHADQILVLDHGRLAGAGTHPELLDRCDAYRTLWDTDPPPEQPDLPTGAAREDA